jgi:FkbM family methyltransferase
MMRLAICREFLGWVRDHYGLTTALAHALQLVWRDKSASLSVPKVPSVVVRPGTADLSVFEEVFRQNGYDFDLPSEPRIIVDAGAHIGLMSVALTHRYPEARIIAIEPEGGNFRILCEQAKRHPRIEPLRAALWARDTEIQIANPTAATWSFRTEERGDGIQEAIPAISLPTLMTRYKLERIDLLKMDIEGAEADVLASADEWIDRVDTLVVELHDRHRPGCSAALERAIAGRGFTRQSTGENVVLTRKR